MLASDMGWVSPNACGGFFKNFHVICLQDILEQAVYDV